MNTNETQEIEIPDTWDVTVQAAERRGYRAGVEAADQQWMDVLRRAIERNEADKLLAEQEEKK